jgi:Histidine kinase-, DNA gyrase B-, and HSP90-like ATPase
VPPKPTFTVDTHLFRELGELLVGRDSTALIELIKNSYDADASWVQVHGENLDDPEHGRILIRDDGIGMSRMQFVRGFLTIAGRTKELGARRSLRYGRRYTGEKGIGRLAAHKLARQLAVRTIPWTPEQGGQERGVNAGIDWDAIESYDTLAQAAAGVSVRTFKPTPRAHEGTVVSLTKLRRKWTQNELETFLGEAQTFELPHALVARLPGERVERALLFRAPKVRDGRKGDPGFSVRLSGAFEDRGDNWETLLESAIWVVEIRSRPRAKVQYAIAPTKRTLKEYPEARPTRISIAHPDPANGPSSTPGSSCGAATKVKKSFVGGCAGPPASGYTWRAFALFPTASRATTG